MFMDRGTSHVYIRCIKSVYLLCPAIFVLLFTPTPCPVTYNFTQIIIHKQKGLVCKCYKFK